MSSYVKPFTEYVHLRRWGSCWEPLRAIAARARLPRKRGSRRSSGAERPFPDRVAPERRLEGRSEGLRAAGVIC
jgi:hypothetical protein